MRRKLRIALLILALLTATILVHQYAKNRALAGLHLVKQDIQSAGWSLDGRSILYTTVPLKGPWDHKLYKYHLQNAKTSAFVMSDEAYYSRVSPDGRSILIASSPDSNIRSVDVFSWSGAKIQHLLSPKGPMKRIDKLMWPAPNYMLFESHGNIYRIIGENIVVKMLENARFYAKGSDGTAFIWSDEARRFHLFDVVAGKDKLLYAHRRTDTSNIYFPYISNRLVVAWYRGGRHPFLELVNLNISNNSKIKMDEIIPERYQKAIDEKGHLERSFDQIDISSDMTKCLYFDSGRYDYIYSSRPSKLYVVDIPAATTAKLRVFTQKSSLGR